MFACVLLFSLVLSSDVIVNDSDDDDADDADDDDTGDDRYGSGTLTNVFIDRVFQECLTYDGEMDYKTYLDFVLAVENRKEPPSLQYMFRLLDVQNKGFLNIFDLNYFFRVMIILFIICYLLLLITLL